MRIGLRRTRVTAIAVLAGLLAIGAGAPPALAGGSIWTRVPSPNPATKSVSNDALSGVSALSDSAVWAVGDYSSSGGNNVQHTLVERWNGSTWMVVPSPDMGALGSALLGVTAISSTDVWAVGEFSTSSTANGARTLIEHFDGTTWSIVPSPNPSTQGDNLTAVAALGPDNVWAVGYYENNGQSALLPLVLHFDGTKWSMVTAGLGAAAGTVLHGISAFSANDIWAVGEAGFGTNRELHWDGMRWSVASASFTSGGQESLGGVGGAASNDVWAVGSYAPTISAELQTLILHWDGHGWRKVTSPNVDTYFNLLFGVAALRSNDVWAVGYAYTTDGLSFNNLIEHWDGTQWSIVPTPAISASELRGVVQSGPSSLWAAGTFISFHRGGGIRTLTMHTTQG